MKRLPIDNPKLKESIHFRVDQFLLREIQRKARTENKDLSSIIRIAIEESIFKENELV